MILLNAWYVACTPTEIDDKPLGRTLCKQPIVFHRSGDGTVAALEDFCPRRGAPLLLGRVIEGKLVCGYHGLQMGCRWAGDGLRWQDPRDAGPAGARLPGDPQLSGG